MAPAILKAGLDILVIQGTVVSAEHVSKTVEPLNLKKFIREFERRIGANSFRPERRFYLHEKIYSA